VLRGEEYFVVEGGRKELAGDEVKTETLGLGLARKAGGGLGSLGALVGED